jgi:hypothetical protein
MAENYRIFCVIHPAFFALPGPEIGWKQALNL